MTYMYLSKAITTPGYHHLLEHIAVLKEPHVNTNGLEEAGYTKANALKGF